MAGRSSPTHANKQQSVKNKKIKQIRIFRKVAETFCGRLGRGCEEGRGGGGGRVVVVGGGGGFCIG